MNQYQHLSDEALMEAYRSSGQERWLGVLLDRYSLQLLGVCMKYLREEELARDTVQLVFAKAITELRKYEVSYFKSWLMTIARNQCLMHLRQKHPQQVPMEEETPDDLEEPWETKQMHQHNDLLMQLLQQALDLLQEPQKTCVQLFYLHKRSYRQIADSERLSLLQVKSSIQNGKRNIKKWIEAQLKNHQHAS